MDIINMSYHPRVLSVFREDSQMYTLCHISVHAFTQMSIKTKAHTRFVTLVRPSVLSSHHHIQCFHVACVYNALMCHFNLHLLSRNSSNIPY